MPASRPRSKFVVLFDALERCEAHAEVVGDVLHVRCNEIPIYDLVAVITRNVVAVITRTSAGRGSRRGW